MGELTDILKALSTYGTPLIIVAIILFFAVKIGNIFVDDFRHRRMSRNHDAFAELRSRLGATINAILERAVLRTRADRAFIFEFHNGSKSVGGLPFLKMTNTYEALGEGARTEMHKRADMPFHLYQRFVDAVYENDFIVMDVDNRTDRFTQFEYETLIQRDVLLTIRVKITDINRKVIGHAGVDYCLKRPDAATVEDAVRVLRGVAAEVGSLLSVNESEGNLREKP